MLMLDAVCDGTDLGGGWWAVAGALARSNVTIARPHELLRARQLGSRPFARSSIVGATNTSGARSCLHPAQHRA